MFLTAAKIANMKKVFFNCQKENRKKNSLKFLPTDSGPSKGD